MSALGDVLRRQRLFAGLTMQQLGQRLGIWNRPAQRIGQWESGYRKPRAAMLGRIEKILGLPEGTLLAEAAYLEMKERETMENKVMEAILARRSVRSYENRPVEKEKLKLLLQAAIHGPSAMNLQPWQYTVLNRATRDALVAGMGEDVFFGAPTVIMVSCDKGSYWAPIDCGLSGENLLLMATQLGLGTCVIGCMREFLETDAGKRLVAGLELPRGYGPLYAIAVGYPAAESNARPRDESKAGFMEEIE